MPTGARLSVFFDVNETLSDLSGVAAVFERLGAGGPMMRTWFASVLRDGFALTASGGSPRFAEIAEGDARVLLAGLVEASQLDDAVQEVMTAFTSAPAHPDVAPGLRRLHAAGHRLFTLSNGAASTAERLLETSGSADLIEGFLSVEEHSPWKPARDSYLSALARTGTEPADAVLVAVHPWDIDGAARAGLSTVLVDRAGTPYPQHFHRPTRTVASLADLDLG